MIRQRFGDSYERGQRHVVMYVINRRTGLRFERVWGFGVLRTLRLHGAECRFCCFTNLPFNGYFLKLTRRRNESRAPFFLLSIPRAW